MTARVGRVLRSPRSFGALFTGVVLAGGLAISTAVTVAGATGLIVTPTAFTTRTPSASPTTAGSNDASIPRVHLSQSIAVAVRSGGPLRLSSRTITVVLRPAGHTLAGTFGPITLVDPRGTLAGWRLLATAAAPAGSDLTVIPGQPTAVDGDQSDLTGASSARLLGGRGAVLMSAARGGGGGTFAVAGRLVEPVARGTAAVRVVTLRLSAR